MTGAPIAVGTDGAGPVAHGMAAIDLELARPFQPRAGRVEAC